MNDCKLIIEEFACWGCKACEVACKQEHHQGPHGAYDPSAARDAVKYLSVWGDGPKVVEGRLDFVWRVSVCKHCVEPACVLSCPQEAIARDRETGIVLLDRERCDGCSAVPGRSGAEKQGISPCKAGCPGHNDIQGCVSLAAVGRYREALELIKETSPFPSVCGRVCYHPCESGCNRNQIDESVDIQSVERFVADRDFAGAEPYVPKIKKARDEKVAIIGSGPAGLTAAYFLAREGYRVTVFERLPVAGGMLAVGIPAYRLPRDILSLEIGVIEAMGVEIRTGVEVGKDVTIEQLRGQGTKAFFLAVGAQACKRLGLEGEELQGVYPGVDFLRRLNLGEKVDLGERVAVVGGGNVAVDAARSALRSGSKEVFVLYRRSLEEMPASAEEIREGREEGIEIYTLAAPRRIIGEKGKVKAVECLRMEPGEPDESGRRRPEPVQGSEFVLEVDAVIPAVGQESDWACLGPECACTLSEWGTMNVDPVTQQTEDPDLFAGGDAVSGPGTVIEAIAAGRRAALSMDRYVRGLSPRPEEAVRPVLLTAPFKERCDRASRAPMPRLDPRERMGNFAEVRLGMSEDLVSQEAKRCLSCGSCCIQACPYGAITFDGQHGKAEKCNLCHHRVTNGLYPACADNVCLAHCIYFGEPAEIEKKILDKRKVRGGWGEVIPRALT